MHTFDWDNETLWQIRMTEREADDFVRPYVGNGWMGVRFTELVIGTGSGEPPVTVTKEIYDDGKQLVLPVWNQVILETEGICYRPDTGKHRFLHILDLRSGLVSLHDKWEYAEGKELDINIEMLLPRTFKHCSYLSVTVQGLLSPLCITFGLFGGDATEHFQMDFNRIGDDVLLGQYMTKFSGCSVTQAMRWKQTGLRIESVETDGQHAAVKAASTGNRAVLELFHFAGRDAHAHPIPDELRRFSGLSRGEWLDEHNEICKRLWSGGLAFHNEDPAITQMVLAHQFYLLCSLDGAGLPLGPLGLSAPGWNGNVFWDADFWIFRAALALWPELARSIVEYRIGNLEKAKQRAKDNGFTGAWFGWKTDDKGEERAPEKYRNEIHVGIWIALAAWEYSQASGDMDFLRMKAWPAIRNIADFYASRAREEADGFFHLYDVVGPDEAVAERGAGMCNDNFLTNYGVKKVMGFALTCAELAGIRPNERWSAVQTRMYLQKAGVDGVIPEHEGYDGEGIKQADVLLAFYPLDYPADKATILHNLHYYRQKQLVYGPIMASQIESCLLMKYGSVEEGLDVLLQDVARRSKGKFYVLHEDVEFRNGIFLTGIGGELQALIYGYYRAEIGNFSSLPRLGQYMSQE